MAIYIVSISGMHCAHCAESTRKALSALDGVDRVEVDLKKGRAKIFADGPVSASEVSDTIEDIGFEFVSMTEERA
ncbi:MAG: heavy-metal-associated domain-containing protein [Christensenellales bacterium]|jgi:copper chaperone